MPRLIWSIGQRRSFPFQTLQPLLIDTDKDGHIGATARALTYAAPALLDEYRSVLLRPKLAKLHGLTEAQIDLLLVELTANAIWREAKAGSPAPDRGDDHLWALLSAYSGSILVTGDRLLLENPPTRGSMISPSTWLREFSQGT